MQNDAFEQHLGSQNAMFLPCTFGWVVAQAVFAWNKDHRRRRDARHMDRVMAGAGDDVAPAGSEPFRGTPNRFNAIHVKMHGRADPDRLEMRALAALLPDEICHFDLQ